MNKSIKFTQSQIKAKENGATMFLFPTNCLKWKDKNITINEIRNKTQVSFYYTDDESRYEGSGGLLHRHCYIIHIENLIKKNFPLQIGDKDIYVKEEFETMASNGINQYDTMYKDEHLDYIGTWQPSSKMTKEQSRYTLKEILDVKIVRVKDADMSIMYKLNLFTMTGVGGATYEKTFEAHYNRQLKEQNINRTYNDNDYVFLVGVK